MVEKAKKEKVLCTRNVRLENVKKDSKAAK
jgi:hypothetical protein